MIPVSMDFGGDLREDNMGGQNRRRRLSDTRGGLVDWHGRDESGSRFRRVRESKLGEYGGGDGEHVVVWWKVNNAG